MQQALSGIDFAPVLPLWLIGGLGVLAVLALVPAFLRRARGAPLRAAVFALLLLALGNPRLVEETRETRPDIGLLVVDRSDSARIGTRARQLEAARAGIEARVRSCPTSSSAPSRCRKAATRAPGCSPPPNGRWPKSPAPGWPASSP